MQAFDQMQRDRIRELTDAGETIMRATERVKHETREQYFRLLNKYADIPVYTLPFPSLDYDPPPRAA